MWGIWWTWDARLTTTLVLYLIYVAYLLVRRFVAGPEMRTLAAVIAIFGYLDIPIVYMSTRWWRTQHPAPVFFGGPMRGSIEHAARRVVESGRVAGVGDFMIVAFRYGVALRDQMKEQQEALQALEVTP